MTVLENVVLGAMFGVSAGSSASEKRGGGRPSRWRSSGSESGADQPVSSLNLHQLRFLELAKALAGQPEVLLLDEVMAGLNETGARRLGRDRAERP